MKQNPEEKKIQDRMKPGILTLHGFLGNDTRYLNEIIATDSKLLARLDISRNKIAERMEFFTKQAFESYDGAIIVEKIYSVEYRSVRGRVICPFPEPGTYQKGFVTFTNLKKNITITWTPLNIHMIKDHGFFEGRDSKNRLEPKILIDTLF